MPGLITYNGIDLFSGQPTPFVGMAKENVYYGERWCSVNRISLLGQLTGCDYDEILTSQQALISGFSRNFQSLVINTGTFDNIVVNSISFPQSRYVKIVPYQIELSHYPQNSFSGFYGVIDPSDSWSYNQTEDGIIEITHEISAKGIQFASSGALSNAKSFVLSRTGFSNYISPQFIQNSVASGILKSQAEKIDRLNATYSIIENYTSDQFYPSDYGILRYTVEQGLNQAGFNSASIQGSFQGGINDNFSTIKSRADGFNYYSALSNGISGSTLNTTPLSKRIVENQNLRKIDFSLSYDDNPSGQTNTIYNININSGVDLISVSVNGEINGRGDLKDRWALVQTAFSSVNPYSIASSALTSYGGGTLNPNSKAESVTKDAFNGTISFDYSYQDSPDSLSSDLQEFNYEITFRPPIRKIISSPLILKAGSTIYSKYEITDMGLDSRGQFSINGGSVPKRATSTAGTLSATEIAIGSLFSTYTAGYSNIYLEGYNLTSSNNENLTFNTEWSYESDGVIAGTNYTTINSL